MSPSPVLRAESLLSEAVLHLYAAFRANDFPEHYIRKLLPITLSMLLRELRTLGPAQVLAKPASSQPDHEGFQRHLDLADQQIRRAIVALWLDDAALAVRYVEASAQGYMAGFLRRLRDEETPPERAALMAEVNRLRASVDLEPLSWEQVVSRTLG